MGTDAHVVVRGHGPSPEAVLDRLGDLERRWTRFDPGSEVSRLGRSGGRPAIASPDTMELLDRCVRA